MYNFGEGVVIRIQNLHYTINRNLPWKDKIQGLHHIHNPLNPTLVRRSYTLS